MISGDDDVVDPSSFVAYLFVPVSLLPPRNNEDAEKHRNTALLRCSKKRGYIYARVKSALCATLSYLLSSLRSSREL